MLPHLPHGGSADDARRIAVAVAAFLLADLIGVAEAATILGVSRQAVSQRLDHPDFPKAVARIAAGPVYSKTDVVEWQTAHPNHRR